MDPAADKDTADVIDSAAPGDPIGRNTIPTEQKSPQKRKGI